MLRPLKINGVQTLQNKPVWLIMPLGSSHGWGVCGKYLTLEMARLGEIHFVTEGLQPIEKEDTAHVRALSDVYVPLTSLESKVRPTGVYSLDGPVLQSIRGADLRPWYVPVEASRVIGYTFFERSTLGKDQVLAARDYYDWIVAGSTWCENVLRSHGIADCSTIIQGIDSTLFHPRDMEKQQNKDKFVIFSGGKIELRKGQDLVIRAFKVLQDKYDDVCLVNAWYNMWDASVMTMGMSPYIRFDMPKGEYFKAINRLLLANGVDPHRVVTLPPLPQARMPEIYRNTDCGLFPNRCEGGTNLVLMEYMACGKPVIASYSTGHRDVIHDDHAVPIHSMKKLNMRTPEGAVIEQWDDPDLDETIAHLEWAYHHREDLKRIGQKAGEYMQSITWRKAAKEFSTLLQQ